MPGAGAAAPMTMRDYLTQQSQKFGIPPDLALAITHTESGGQMGAVSPKGAAGFFQLMPETAKELGVDPSDPFQNIDGGLRYFKQQLDAHGGDVRLALAAYNAGPAHQSLAAGQVPAIPETQDYVMKVLNAWQSGGGQASTPQAAAVAAPPPPAPPAAARAGMLAPSTATSDPAAPAAPPRSFLDRALVDPMTGFGKGVAQTMADTGSLVERVTGAKLPDLPGNPNLAPQSTGESIGKFAEGAAEFALPAEAISGGMKTMQVTQRLLKLGFTPARARLAAKALEGGLQAAPAAALAELHGDDPTSAAILSASLPVAGQFVTEMAPIIRRGAITRMARFMERGVKGDITPELQKSVAQAASDFIDLPLQRTWRQTAAMTRGVREQAGKTLESALAGPLGDTPVPKAALYTALDDLVDNVQHLTPVKGGLRTVTFRPEVVAAVDDLKSLLNEYPPDIPARQLHDLKQVWWKAIYPIREAAQPVGAVRELLTSAQKEAHLRGAKTIAQILEKDAPDIAALDDAVSHAIKLDQFTKRLALKARTGTLAKPAAKYAASAVGGAVGLGAGSAVGHPFIGAHIGYATARMLMSAVESPKWRLLPIAARRSLANALASGQAEQVRKIVTPLILSATADQDNLLSASNSANASR